MIQGAEDKIINAARKVFYEKGYNGATMRDIAKTAEVNLALLHYYFRTKDKIFEIVFTEAFTVLFKKLDKALTSNNDILKKIELMVESYVETAVKQPKLPSFVMSELSTNSQLMVSILNELKKQNKLGEKFELFYQEVEDAVKAKVIKPINTKDLCVNIQSLSFYPFMAKELMMKMLYSTQKEYNEMIKDRARSISQTIINSLML